MDPKQTFNHIFLIEIVSAHETCLVKDNGKHLLPMESSIISATKRNPMLACNVKPPTMQATLTVL